MSKTPSYLPLLMLNEKLNVYLSLNCLLVDSSNREWKCSLSRYKKVLFSKMTISAPYKVAEYSKFWKLKILALDRSM